MKYILFIPKGFATTTEMRMTVLFYPIKISGVLLLLLLLLFLLLLFFNLLWDYIFFHNSSNQTLFQILKKKTFLTHRPVGKRQRTSLWWGPLSALCPCWTGEVTSQSAVLLSPLALRPCWLRSEPEWCHCPSPWFRSGQRSTLW